MDLELKFNAALGFYRIPATLGCTGKTKEKSHLAMLSYINCTKGKQRKVLLATWINIKLYSLLNRPSVFVQTS